MAQQGALATGAQAAWGDDGQDLPQYAGRFDEGRMQLSAPWLRSGAYFELQARIMSDPANTTSLQCWLSTYKPRIQWFYLTPGLRVYGLAMGRCQRMGNATSDHTIYPVHPSRYTISTVDTPPLTDNGEDNDFGFNWAICLDGAVLTLEGGRRVLDIPDEARELPP
jgi:hypothetical protein